MMTFPRLFNLNRLIFCLLFLADFELCHAQFGKIRYFLGPALEPPEGERKEKELFASEYYNFNWTNCEGQTCEGQCGMYNWSSEVYGLVQCSCDEKCLKYGDCCVDFAYHCPELIPHEVQLKLNNNKSVYINTAEPFLGFHHDDFNIWNSKLENETNLIIAVAQAAEEVYKLDTAKQKCVHLAADMYITVITKCDADSTQDLIENCQNGGSHYLLHRFKGETKIYRNVFCALCNDVNTNFSVPIEVSYSCKKLKKAELIQILYKKGRTEFINALRDSCGHFYFLNAEIRREIRLCIPFTRKISAITKSPELAIQHRYKSLVIHKRVLYKTTLHPENWQTSNLPNDQLICPDTSFLSKNIKIPTSPAPWSFKVKFALNGEPETITERSLLRKLCTSSESCNPFICPAHNHITYDYKCYILPDTLHPTPFKAFFHIRFKMWRRQDMADALRIIKLQCFNFPKYLRNCQGSPIKKSEVDIELKKCFQYTIPPSNVAHTRMSFAPFLYSIKENSSLFKSINIWTTIRGHHNIGDSCHGQGKELVQIDNPVLESQYSKGFFIADPLGYQFTPHSGLLRVDISPPDKKMEISFWSCKFFIQACRKKVMIKKGSYTVTDSGLILGHELSTSLNGKEVFTAKEYVVNENGDALVCAPHETIIKRRIPTNSVQRIASWKAIYYINTSNIMIIFYLSQ